MVSTQSQVPKSVLDGFWRLSDTREKARLEAAAKILNGGHDDEYVLTRLVRGLASNRESARKGFFMTLVEIIRNNNKDDIVEKVRRLADSILKVKGATKGEEGDALIGRLLCLTALLRSGKVGVESDAGGLISDIIELSKKRSYLSLPGFQSIIDYLEATNMEGKKFTKYIWITALKDKILWESPSLETVWFMLVVQKLYPKCLDKKFMLQNFGRKKLIVADSFLESLSAALSSSTPIHMLKRHPALSVIVSALGQEKLLTEFWTGQLNDFISIGGSYKTLVAFIVLGRILDYPDLPKEDLRHFLSKEMICTSLQLLSRLDSPPEEDREILSLLAKIVSLAQGDPQVEKAVLENLLRQKVSFDKVTGGNVVQQIIAKASDFAVVEFASEIFREAAKGGEDVTQQERVFSLQQLAKLVGHALAKDKVDWKIGIINFILSTTLFEDKEGVIQPFSRETRIEVKEVLFKAVDFKSNSDLDTSVQILSKVVYFADSLLKCGQPLWPFNKDCRRTWDTMLIDIADIEANRKVGEFGKELKVFELLFFHMGLQLFSDSEMAMETFSELRECYSRAKSKRQNRRKSKTSKEPNWVEVVVDLLISLQAHNKHVLRQLANSVLVALCPQITSDALQAIFDVVNPEPEEKGDNEEDEEWEDLEEEEGVDEDVEEEEEEDEESDDGSEDGADNVDEEMKTRLKSALALHVAAEPENDEDEADLDMDAIPEEEMKRLDVALANVFRVLSKKSGLTKSRKERKDDLAAMHFKIRTLDLLDIYLSNSPLAGHVVMAMEFALSALEAMQKRKSGKRKEQDEPLEVRIRGTLKKIAALKNSSSGFRADPSLDLTALVSVLNSYISLANSGSPIMASLNNPLPLFSQACSLVMKLAESFPDEKERKKAVKAVGNIYQEALKDFFMKHTCMLPISFFMLPLKSNWIGGWTLSSKLIESAFDPKIRQFRRNQALELLTEIFRNCNLLSKAPENVDHQMAILGEKISENLSKTPDADSNVKARSVCDLLILLHALYQANKKLLAKDEGEMPAFWIEKVAKSLNQFRDKVPKGRNFRDVKSAFNRIAAPLGIRVIQGSEKNLKNEKKPTTNGQKTPDPKCDAPVAAKDEGENGSSLKGKRKKQHNKEALLIKKKEKMFALQGQFEGLEMPSFSGVSMESNSNFTLGPQMTVEERRKNPKLAKKNVSENGDDRVSKNKRSSAESPSNEPKKKKTKKK